MVNCVTIFIGVCVEQMCGCKATSNWDDRKVTNARQGPTTLNAGNACRKEPDSKRSQRRRRSKYFAIALATECWGSSTFLLLQRATAVCLVVCLSARAIVVFLSTFGGGCPPACPPASRPLNSRRSRGGPQENSFLPRPPLTSEKRLREAGALAVSLHTNFESGCAHSSLHTTENCQLNVQKRQYR